MKVIGHQAKTNHFNQQGPAGRNIPLKKSRPIPKGEADNLIFESVIIKRLCKATIISFVHKRSSFLNATIINMIKLVVCKNYLSIAHRISMYFLVKGVNSCSPSRCRLHFGVFKNPLTKEFIVLL